MSFVPSTAAQNTAALAGSNQASLAAPLPALQSAISGGLLAPAAYLDAILSSVGLQGQPTSGALSAQNTTSTSFANLTGATFTFNAPIAKVYEVQIQISPFINGATDNMNFRLLNNGSSAADNTTNASMHLAITAASLGVYQLMTFIVPVTCVAGANVLQLQWRLQFGNPSAVLRVDGDSHFVGTVRG